MFTATIPDDRLQLVNIPKLIMQTWKTHTVPQKWVTSPQSIGTYMHDWSYVLMSDDDNQRFVETYFPQYLDMFVSFPHAIQRADAVRYMWLYIHGGLYIDLDYELREPLDRLFYPDSDLYFMASSNVGAYLTNSIMASKPGHPFWLELLEEIERMSTNPKFWAKGKHLEVMMSTGPGILSEVLRKSKYLYMTLPQRLVCPQSICHEKDDSGMLKLLEGSSWAGWDTKAMNWAYCNHEAAILGGVVLFILFILLIVVLARSIRR
jgi:mannosyltransferase OCH1-like enzyme